MFLQLGKLVYASVTQIPFRIVPVLLLLAHWFLRGQILASTSKLKVRHLTRHRKETSKFLLSPLLYIFNINGGSLINYTHIHNPKDGHSYQKSSGVCTCRSPNTRGDSPCYCLSIAGLYSLKAEPHILYAQVTAYKPSKNSEHS